MTDAELMAAYTRACIQLGKVQSDNPWGIETAAQRTAFKRWDELDREMARRGLDRYKP